MLAFCHLLTKIISLIHKLLGWVKRIILPNTKEKIALVETLFPTLPYIQIVEEKQKKKAHPQKQLPAWFPMAGNRSLE